MTGRALFCISHLKQNQQKILKLYTNVYTRITAKRADNWVKFMALLDRHGMRDDKSLIRLTDLLRILRKFRLKLSERQTTIIQKLYKVHYVSDKDVISIQPLRDM